MSANLRNPPKHYERALKKAITMMQDSDQLEPTSALKLAASDHGIPFGEEMGRFVEWGNKRLFSRNREREQKNSEENLIDELVDRLKLASVYLDSGDYPENSVQRALFEAIQTTIAKAENRK